MALEEVTRFRISSSVNAPSDGFEAGLASSKSFVNAVANEAVSLKAGLVDPDTGTPIYFPQLDGIIDRYRLTIRENATTASAVGRDNVALLLDRRTRWLFSRSPVENVNPLLIERVFVGTWLASQIAQTLVEYVGLELSWQCRDYVLVQDFSAVGRIADLLRQLVAPWNVTEMFKVDIYANGSTVFITPRPGVITAPGITIDLQTAPKQIRANEISVEKRRLPFIGRVTIRGSSSGGGGAEIIQNRIVEDEQVAETYGKTGGVTSRTVTVTHTQLPDGITIDRRSTTWVSSGSGLVKAKEEITEWSWTQSTYDSLGRRISRPKLIEQTTRVYATTDDGSWGQKEEQRRSIAYDSQERVIADDEIKSTQDSTTGGLTPSERALKEYSFIANGMVEEVTSTFGWDSSAKAWTLDRMTVQRNHGGLQQFGLVGGAGGTGATGSTTERVEIISTDPWAEDMEISNPNLTAADVEFILTQLRQVSGKWQYEIRVPQVAMPWATKGMTIQLTNIPVGKTLRGGIFEADAAISLPSGILTAREFTYDESGDAPSMTATLTIMAWSDT